MWRSKHKNLTDKFNLRDYLKDGITDNEMDKCEYVLKLWRALREECEFENRTFSGDDEWSSKVPHVVALGYVLVEAIGRVMNERAWSSFQNELETLLRKCTVGNQESTLKTVIKRREGLSRIMHYIYITDDEFGKIYYGKLFAKFYEGVITEKKELFDVALDLYFRLHSKGPYNKDTYLKCILRRREVEEKDLETVSCFKTVVKSFVSELGDLENRHALTQDITTVTTTENGGQIRDNIKGSVYNAPTHMLNSMKNTVQALEEILN